MKILLACMLHSYGDPKREYSFEYYNFYLVLKQMGYDVQLFDYASEITELGKNGMNQKLLSLVKEWQPKITLFSLYTDQFEPSIVIDLSNYTKTLCFFHDDTWRVDYSRFWAKHFNYFTTPDIHGEVKYSRLNLQNAIYFPFGCNQTISRKLNTEKKYDVSFVGGWHPYRNWIINRITKAKINIKAVGYGWPNGEVDQESMIQLFNESRINLNLSNSASWDFRYLSSSPRALLNRIRSKKNIEQMKARIFEINGCGAFQLSYYVEGLSNCYEIDKEIAVYSDPDDLIEKIRFYLKHNSIRESIAEAGFKRTLNNHTYTQRFQTVFRRMGINEI